MEDIILKQVLLNSVGHQGRASAQAVLGKVLAESPELKSDIKGTVEKIKAAISKVGPLPVEEQRKMLGKFGAAFKKPEKTRQLPDLPGAENGSVVMRMAPYPSGPLHIGNARMVLLNDEYVKMYGGRLLLVYDDTIGSEEKPIVKESYEMIRDSLEWLGVRVDGTFYKSDRMETFYRYAEGLLGKGIAYVCLCDAETLRKSRERGVECPHRDSPAEENLGLWKRMLEGKFGEGGATVRLKTDMRHPNPAFRDRVLLRVAERVHPRVGSKYSVWPMLEFSWAIDDHLLGVTHILRGKDLAMEDQMEEFLWGKLGWGRSKFIHYGMLNIAEAKLSKTQSRKNIEQGIYSGWDDPRTWSMQSLRRRGVQPGAIRKFVLNMGLSLADVTIPAEILYAENRKLIDPLADRYFAVIDPVLTRVANAPEIDEAEAPVHPDFPERGRKRMPVNMDKIYLERADLHNLANREARLMDLCNVIVKDDCLEFTSREMKMDMPKIQWVSEPNRKTRIVMPDGTTRDALAEPGINDVKEDELVQLVRVGFCRVDHSGKDIVLRFAHK